MVIVIKNKSELPIYEQIKQQMKAQILDGSLREDEQLPSIRQLARDLKISVITTTRAYNDLLDETIDDKIIVSLYYYENSSGQSGHNARDNTERCSRCIKLRSYQ